MLGEMRTVGLVSTTVQTADEKDRTQDFPDTPEVQPDRVCARRQLRNTLARAIGVLPERYQKVVFLYYTNEMTMKEIGAILGGGLAPEAQHKNQVTPEQIISAPMLALWRGLTAPRAWSTRHPPSPPAGGRARSSRLAVVIPKADRTWSRSVGSASSPRSTRLSRSGVTSVP